MHRRRFTELAVWQTQVNVPGLQAVCRMAQLSPRPWARGWSAIGPEQLGGCAMELVFACWNLDIFIDYQAVTGCSMLSGNSHTP